MFGSSSGAGAYRRSHEQSENAQISASTRVSGDRTWCSSNSDGSLGDGERMERGRHARAVMDGD